MHAQSVGIPMRSAERDLLNSQCEGANLLRRYMYRTCHVAAHRLSLETWLEHILHTYFQRLAIPAPYLGTTT